MTFTKEQIEKMPNDRIESLFRNMIDKMTDVQFKEWALNWFDWTSAVLETINVWDVDVKRDELVESIDILNRKEE